ncbi:MAG: response regulator [Lachnospiraceae bacterium]|nr:response regulator [Lachnospiraceae bacterium]
MKKVFFIGKFNALYGEVSGYLEKMFNVQICSDDLSVLKNMLIVSKPDIILFSLLGVDEERSDIFSELRSDYASVPLMCLEPPGENVTEEEIQGIEKFKALMFPATNEEITENICGLLGLKYDADNKVVVESQYDRKCVMAIDDNSMQLRVLNELLKDEYDVLTATSAVKALTMIGKRVPDVILLDYEMPICDGKMALQMIREIEEAKDVPVIFLTSVRDAAHIKAVVDLHPAGYLLKPAKGSTIIETIKQHIK